MLEYFVQKPLGLGYTVKGGEIVKSKDAKDQLADFVEDMAKQMIAIANVQVCAVFPSVAAMNQAIFKEHDRVKSENLYAKDAMRNRYLAVKKLSNGRFSLDKLIEGMLKKQSSLFREFYKMMVNAWFQKDSHGGKMANSFIDFVNLDVVEANRDIPLIYITEEVLFNEMMDKVDLECLNDTKKFYKEFYLG